MPSGTSIQQEDPKPAADPNRVRSSRAHRGSQHNKKGTDLLPQNCLGWNGPSNLQQFGVEETFNPKTVWGGRDLQSHKRSRWDSTDHIVPNPAMDRDTSYSPQYHGIIWVGRDLEGHRIPPLSWHCPANCWAMAPHTTSTSPFSSLQGWGLSSCPGLPSQCFTTLPEWEFFLTLNLPFLWHNLRPFPHVLSFTAWEKKDATNWMQPHQPPPNTASLLSWTQTH